jgi:methylmalonyl-CoA mutase cobalamin-binding subunit
MVLSTPAGERHELGILMCALLAAAKNVRCHYLGPDLPGAELATYATRVHADVVVLSVLMQDDPNGVATQFGELAQLLPEQIEIWGGGIALRQVAGGRLPPRVKFLESLSAFEREITLLEARVPR